MYAVIKTGGKQYKIQEGTVLEVEKLAADIDSEIELAEILMISNGDKLEIGKPLVKAKVVAIVKAHGQGDKKIKKKIKKKHMKKTKKRSTTNTKKKKKKKKKDIDNNLLESKSNQLLYSYD